jgi:uncharacterized repeat protein (TIGR02543 family)
VHIGFNNADNGVYLAADQNIVITADLPADARIVLADKAGAVNGTKVAQKLPAEGEPDPDLSKDEAALLIWQKGDFSVSVGLLGSSGFYVLDDRSIQFTSAEADGVANTTRSTKITLTFSEDIAGLAANDITLTPDDGSTTVTRGSLTHIGAADSGAYDLAISGTWDEGDTVDVTVAKSGFNITPATREATLHDGAPPEITYISATADGDAGVTTSTKITLAFDDDIAGLAVSDLTLTPSGAAIVTKGTLMHTGDAGSGTYDLVIYSGEWDEGDTVAVAVAKDGFTITPATRTATLHAATSAPNVDFTLYFNKNAADAVEGSIERMPVTVGKAVGTLPGIGSGAPTRSHYVFRGWAETQVATAPDFTEAKVWSEYDDGTVYAVWARDSHTITYHSSGHTSGAVPAQTTHEYGDVVALQGSGSLTRTHYTFAGWSSDAAAVSVTHLAGSPFLVGNDADFYAVWREDAKYSVTYDANGGERAPYDANTYYSGDTVTVAPAGNMARSGYAFTGWALSGGGAVSYSAGDTFGITGDTTLFAVWEADDETDDETIVIPPPEDDPGDPGDPEVPGDSGGGDNSNGGDGGAGTGGGTNTTASTGGSPLALLSDGEVVTQAELNELARDEGIPVLDIGDDGVPLAGVEGYAYWSLVDLAIALIGIILALWFTFRGRRRESDPDSPVYESERPRRPLVVFVIVAAAANIVLFLLTQDLTGAPLVIVDIWTIPEAVIFIAECLLGRSANKQEKAVAEK